MIIDNKDIYITALIFKSACAGLKLQRKDGSFPEGKNGPWNHIVTPVRNTSHWAILLYNAYLISNDNKLRTAAINACNYLLEPSVRPHNSAFYCRIGPNNRIKSNGLIGQAWAVEPLIYIGKHENNDNYLDLAEHILTIHPFDSKNNLFESIEIDGQPIGINYTLNQQIYFMAMILYFQNYTRREIESYPNAICGLKNILKKISIYDDGCINHVVKKNDIYNIYKKFMKVYSNVSQKKQYTPQNHTNRELSIGYHSFILLGLSIAYKNSKEQSFWQNIITSRKIINALNFSIFFSSSEKLNSCFAHQYNPTGIENAIFYKTFQDFFNLQDNSIKNQLNTQLNNHYNYSSNLMNKSTVDADTLSARIYELCYL